MSVYLYYHCNEWKEFSSMRLQGVYATGINGRDKLATQIVGDKIKGDIEFDNFDKLVTLIKKSNIEEANDLMKYGYIACEEVEG